MSVCEPGRGADGRGFGGIPGIDEGLYTGQSGYTTTNQIVLLGRRLWALYSENASSRSRLRNQTHCFFPAIRIPFSVLRRRTALCCNTVSISTLHGRPWLPTPLYMRELVLGTGE